MYEKSTYTYSCFWKNNKKTSIIILLFDEKFNEKHNFKIKHQMTLRLTWKLWLPAGLGEWVLPLDFVHGHLNSLESFFNSFQLKITDFKYPSASNGMKETEPFWKLAEG